MAVLKEWLIEALEPLAHNHPAIEKDIREIKKRNIPDEPKALLVIFAFILRTIFRSPSVMDDKKSNELWILAHFCDDNIIVLNKKLENKPRQNL